MSTPTNTDQEKTNVVTPQFHRCPDCGFELWRIHNAEHSCVSVLTCRLKILEHALQRIERWFGELPATEKYWDTECNRPLSYSSSDPLNTQRNRIRKVAREALEQSKK